MQVRGSSRRRLGAAGSQLQPVRLLGEHDGLAADRLGRLPGQRSEMAGTSRASGVAPQIRSAIASAVARLARIVGDLAHAAGEAAREERHRQEYQQREQLLRIGDR